MGCTLSQKDPDRTYEISLNKIRVKEGKEKWEEFTVMREGPTKPLRGWFNIGGMGYDIGGEWRDRFHISFEPEIYSCSFLPSPKKENKFYYLLECSTLIDKEEYLEKKKISKEEKFKIGFKK